VNSGDPHANPHLQPEVPSLILDGVSDAVIAIDNGGVVTYLNRSAERQYEVRATEAIGRPLAHLYEYRWVHPADEQAGCGRTRRQRLLARQ